MIAYHKVIKKLCKVFAKRFKQNYKKKKKSLQLINDNLS